MPAAAGQKRDYYELLPVDERTGFRLLPRPSAGDIFFDMEGDPLIDQGGLEYLFGLRYVEKGKPRFAGILADANTPVVVTNVSAATANLSGRLRIEQIFTALLQ